MNENNDQVKLTIIGEDMELTGELWTSDDIRIDGRFYGELESKGRIVISNKGFVKGNITGYNIIVQGKAEGDFEAKHNFQISPGGYMEGSVRTRFINITESAYFNGTCNITPVEKVSDSPKGIRNLVFGTKENKSSNKEEVSAQEPVEVKSEEELPNDFESERKGQDYSYDGAPTSSILKSKISQIQSL